MSDPSLNLWRFAILGFKLRPARNSTDEYAISLRRSGTSLIVAFRGVRQGSFTVAASLAAGGRVLGVEDAGEFLVGEAEDVIYGGGKHAADLVVAASFLVWNSIASGAEARPQHRSQPTWWLFAFCRCATDYPVLWII